MRARKSAAPGANAPAPWTDSREQLPPDEASLQTLDPRDAAETALLRAISVDRESDADADGPDSVADRRTRGNMAGTTGTGTWRSRREAVRSLWPLLPILLVQGVFAWRLLVTNTAFLDEATYMWSGRLVADHLVHGKSTPEFQTFFSGAPVIYPVLAAVASKLGALTAARALSLVCMLLATSAVFLTGRRLHGAMAGFFAAALFAALGPTLHLSSYATFDAMALSMLAWSTYFVIRFAYGESRNALLYGAILMVLADCTKYACLLWNPVIILLAATTGPGFAAWRCSRSWNLQRFAMVSTTLLALAFVIGRQPYFTGFDHTTLQRAAAGTPTGTIVSHVIQWVGPLLALGVLGLLLALWQLRRGTLSRPQAATMAVLLTGGVLAPANQLRIHTLLSLEKHADIGATFAAIPAGYLLARLVRTLGGSRVSGVGRVSGIGRVRYAFAAVFVMAVSLIPLNVIGVRSGTELHNTWPNSTPLISALKPLVQKGSANYLVEDYDVPAYYLPSINYWQWHDTVSGSWYDSATRTTLTGASALKAEIVAHHYQVIVLDYSESPTTDAAITGTIGKAGYRKVAKISLVSGNGTKLTYDIWVV